MDGIVKVQFLIGPSGTIHMAGNAFPFSGGKVRIADLADQWRPILAQLPANADRLEEKWVITARHVAEHAGTQLGLQREGGRIEPAQVITEHFDEGMRPVTIGAHPVTRESVVRLAAPPKPKTPPQAPAPPKAPPALASAPQTPALTAPKPLAPPAPALPPSALAGASEKDKEKDKK